MPDEIMFLGAVVLPDRIVPEGAVLVAGGRIRAVGPRREVDAGSAKVVDAGTGYVAPGYVDVHVHGGAGHDFMDCTPEAFEGVCRAHARHGTTSLTPTTTVGTHQRMLSFLELCRHYRAQPTGGARVLGCHFYGPYFNYDARGAHPGGDVRPPESGEWDQYLEYADALTSATVAPELPNAEACLKAFAACGIRTNVGHSFATFEQMEAAITWGVRHVDHLFCAMSDRARLKLSQPWPMRAGVMEVTLCRDDVTTEIIADGYHLDAGLMKTAYRLKGPDRLALVTDSMRALDMPDGGYIIGPLEGGEPVLRRGGVGLMPDGVRLGSSVQGMDHMVRTFRDAVDVPVEIAIRMASLTPARIAGWDDRIGSLDVGKRADVLVLDRQLAVERVFLEGVEIHSA